MPQRVVPRKSSVVGKVPAMTDLLPGEIAVNHADGKIYSRNPADNTVVNLTGAPELHSHQIAQIGGLQTALDSKVTAVSGKQLSTEDFTTAEKQTLATMGSNGAGTRFFSTAAPTGGVNGDIWYVIEA